jgi:hypothetical protein
MRGTRVPAFAQSVRPQTTAGRQGFPSSSNEVTSARQAGVPYCARQATGFVGQAGVQRFPPSPYELATARQAGVQAIRKRKLFLPNVKRPDFALALLLALAGFTSVENRLTRSALA